MYFFVAIIALFCYNVCVMKNKTHIFVSRKHPLTWLMVLCMLGSVVTRILFVGMKGADLWSQIILPITAAVLYAFITLKSGKERFYKTTIPVLLMMIYFYIVLEAISFGSFDTMITIMYAVILLIVVILYSQLTATKARLILFLIPAVAIPCVALCYVHRSVLLSASFWTGNLAFEHLGGYRAITPDVLMTLGVFSCILATERHPIGQYHPTWGDRPDGRRIRTEPPMNQVSPYIMVTRNTATNYFAESFEITHIERYIRQKRKEGLTNFGITHVLLAAYCRAVAKYPAINRFIAGQKIYSRGKDLQFCMTIKKEMSTDSPETIIKVHLTPHDTAEDVYRKMNEKVEDVKNTPLDSSFDNTAHFLMLIPGVFLKFVVWLLKTLDYFGLLPKFLLEVSPFHGSFFFTSMGSLGILPIYHHLYDFGNMPLFGSFGCKRRVLEVQEDGSVVQRKYLDCKFCMDERIVDGFYYASFFKHYRRILMKPETMDLPPEEVLDDID